MLITELPFGLPGKVYRSAMPFGLYDADEEIMGLCRENNISVIVLLAEEMECLRKAKRNLYDLYFEQGFRVIHLPIADFNIPSIDSRGLARGNLSSEHGEPGTHEVGGGRLRRLCRRRGRREPQK